MILLDTNALSHLQERDPVGDAIAITMASSTDQGFRITTINAYEMLGGAEAKIGGRSRLLQEGPGIRPV